MTLSPGTVGQSAGGVFNSQSIFNALVPREGPKMVPFVANFPTSPSYLIDLTLTMQQTRITVIQSMFLDCSQATASVTVSVQGTQLVIELEAGDQGFFPLLVPDTGAKITIASTSTKPATIILMNVPVPASVWHTSASGGGGAVTATITAPLAPDTGGGVTPVAIAQMGGAVAWTDHSIASTAAATSSPLFAASLGGFRFFVRVKAPETADLWVNPKGGTCGIGLVGCFKIPAGSLYENFPGESVYEAWTYFCATGALVIFAQTQEGN